MNENCLVSAWFALNALPFPVRGYYVKGQELTGHVHPVFTRDKAEYIVEAINKIADAPLYEWVGGIMHTWAGDNMRKWSGDSIIPTEAGRHLGLAEIQADLGVLFPLAFFAIPAYLQPHWEVVSAPCHESFHLRLEAEYDDDEVSIYANGATLIQALAALEVKLIDACGVDAAFEKHCCFLNRDIVSIVEDLDEVGGVFKCYDFSSPETAFRITRILPP